MSLAFPERVDCDAREPTSSVRPCVVCVRVRVSLSLCEQVPCLPVSPVSVTRCVCHCCVRVLCVTAVVESGNFRWSPGLFSSVPTYRYR